MVALQAPTAALHHPDQAATEQVGPAGFLHTVTEAAENPVTRHNAN